MVLNQFADDLVGNEEVVLGDPVTVARADQGSVLQESSDILLTAISVQEARVDAFVSPQGEHDGFDKRVFRGKGLGRRGPVSKGFAVPWPGVSLERVSPRADSDIGTTLPVAPVMDGFEAFPGEVGDFVVLVACGSQTVDEGVVHLALCLFINTLGTVPL